jgi:hypothetical protein
LDDLCTVRPRESDVQVDEVDLGTWTVRRAFGAAGSDTISIDVPDDAVSMLVNADLVDDALPLVIGFDLVTAPDDALDLDLQALYSRIDQPLRNWPYPGIGEQSMLVPNSTADRLPFPPGVWTWRQTSAPFAFGDPWPDVDVEVTAYVKRAALPIESGTIDLVIWPVDLAFDAAGAPDDARLQEALDTIDTVYAQVGISLGDVSYLDPPAGVEAALGVIDSVSGPGSELSELYQLSAGQEGPVVCLFLVHGLSGVLGIAGGVPGPAMLHGSPRSGVAANADPAIATGEQLGGILAHEIGHYLGLFHTTEEEGRSYFTDDPIADTVTGDETNLMWPVSLNASRNLTGGQGFVMRLSPLVL